MRIGQAHNGTRREAPYYPARQVRRHIDLDFTSTRISDVAACTTKRQGQFSRRFPPDNQFDGPCIRFCGLINAHQQRIEIGAAQWADLGSPCHMHSQRHQEEQH